jgi:DNA-binding response OmpR family regulator
MTESKPFEKNLGKYDILIAEDDKDLRRILAFNLESHGFSVRQAENGRVALDRVREKRPDCIILDVMMPEMDGLEVCKRLKSLDSTKDIPIVILSARSAVEEKVQGLQLDADDYMAKPFDFNELLARVYLHISKRNVKSVDLERAEAKVSRSVVIKMSESISSPMKKLRENLIELMDQVRGHPELEHLVRTCEEQRRIVNEVFIQFHKEVDPFFELSHDEEETTVKS